MPASPYVLLPTASVRRGVICTFAVTSGVRIPGRMSGESSVSGTQAPTVPVEARRRPRRRLKPAGAHGAG